MLNKNDFIKEKIKNYYKTKTIKKKQINSYLEKEKTDVIYRIIHNLSNRLNNEFKKKKIKRTLKYNQYLDCNPNMLKNHLENLFKENMNYENYGEWEVDHIKPISSFNLNDLDEAKKCFNYKNLQPLWKKDNLKKSNKINCLDK